MRTLFRAVKLVPFRRVLPLLFVFNSWLHSQPQENAKPVSNIKEILVLAAQPKAEVDYHEVFRVLDALNLAERKSALEQLIGSANQGLAVTAADIAARNHNLDSVPLIASSITSWSPYNQTAVLQRLPLLGDDFLEIPRRLVRSILQGAQQTEQANTHSEPAGIAALLLARKPDPADRQLLLALAEVRSRSWGVWMAIANAGAMDHTRVELASRAYNDSTVPIITRVAAAAALEPFDSRAAAFATAQLQSFLTKFGNNDMGQMLVDARQETSDAPSEYLELRTRFQLLSAMLVLKAEAAHELTFRFLSATNGEIRIHCGIVAALRWPDEFLKSGQGMFSDSEYADLLAVVVQHHPDQFHAAAVRITSSRMATAKSRIDRLGLGGFGLPGTILGIF